MDENFETEVLTGTEEETEVDWDLFSDEETVDDETEVDGAEDAGEDDADDPSAEDTQADEGAQQEDGEGAAEDEPVYTVKFYGQEKQMPLPELIANAQKGMDYDRVRTEADTARPVMQLVQEIAQSMNLSVEDYVSHVRQSMQGAQLEQQVQTQVAAGMPEAEARELAQLRQEKAAWDAQQTAQQQKQEQLAPWTQLLAEYPDVQPDTMPPEVMQRIAKGETPLAAMRAWELAKIKTEQAAKDAAGRNKQTAPGSAKSAGAKLEGDEWLRELMGD